MLSFLVAPENVAFTGALLLMLLIGLAEAIGVGGSALGLHLDADAHVDGDHLLGWLGVGRLPLSVLLVVFLAIFGLIGLIGQQWAAAAFGAPLAGLIAAPAAALAALPLTGLSARSLARVLPRDETTAIDLELLIGRRGVIVTGRAAIGSPARARIEDRFGQAHFVMVEPNAASESFAEGDSVQLIRREGHVFRAIGQGAPSLLELN